MNLIPIVDPIPLPAPVWLFKALHILTLALHFIAMQMLLGGLLIASWLNASGAARRATEAGRLQLNAAASMASRLPVVMTYVINLGVPPLLFAQVLYGRMLYTSSVLIGAWWIAVIFLLMGCYWLLYRFAAGAEAGKSVWIKGVGAWLLAGAIAKIYSTNMTLMLRPEVWNSMYSNTATGIKLPPVDPAVAMMPRWGFMMLGGFVMAGLWMIWLSGRKAIEEKVRGYLSAVGGRFALLAVAQVALAYVIYNAQPAGVKQELNANLVYKVAMFGWFASVALTALLGAWTGLAKARAAAAAWGALLSGFLLMATMTLYRDGIRDVTLKLKNYNVWERAIETNWSVVGLFLVLFVAGLGVIGWLVSVVIRAKPQTETIVPTAAKPELEKINA